MGISHESTEVQQKHHMSLPLHKDTETGKKKKNQS